MFRSNSENLLTVIKELAIAWIMRQTACLVVKPIIIDGYALLFNRTTTVRALDSTTASS